MKHNYKDFLGWVVTTNGDPWRLETEEDVDDFLMGRAYKFRPLTCSSEDEVREVMAKLDIPTGEDCGEWLIEECLFEDGEKAYMGIEV